MLFEEDAGQVMPKELLEQLRQRAKDVAKVIRDLREENRELKEKQAPVLEEFETLKSKLAFYENERRELKSEVEELLKEFEQVSR